MELGVVHVTLEHTARARLPHEWAGAWDKRFLAAVILVVAAGSWVESAESWLRHRADHGELSAGGRIATALIGQRSVLDPRHAAAVPGPEAPPVPSETVQIPDGPPHHADDRKSGTGWSRWYRRAVPMDVEQLDAARQRLRVDPEDSVARRIVARAAYDGDDHETAGEHYRWLVERAPGDRDARLRLAWAEKRQGYHSAEIVHYDAILATDAAHITALAGKAVALARLNRLDESARATEDLETAAPDAVETALAHAKIAGLQGDDDRSLESLERAYANRDQLTREMQLELRRDFALDPCFASLRTDPRLRTLVNRHLGAAGPRQAR